MWGYITMEKGIVYLSTYSNKSGGVTALDATTGQQKWIYNSGSYQNEPAVNDKMVYATDLDKLNIIALDKTNGKLKWEGTGSVAMRQLNASNEYLGGAIPNKPDSAFVCFDANSGKALWSGGRAFCGALP
ncbi:MAG: PQQ-binding-like beta-propeller repeat protein [Leadbetterella sp.]|nr:PQQ-binding-like beta-propeller repeat protein [Leadbetterella sp.]